MQSAFKLNQLTKSYPGFKLGPLDFELERGVVLGYIGPNGSGKTTTLQCMMGLVKANSGDVEITGKRNNLYKPDWKYDVGYIGDTQSFYEKWSGLKNLEFLSQFYPDWSMNYALELARRFDLPLNKRANELSRGNRVKLALIGILAYYPKLLILDEPTARLDPVVRAELFDMLFDAVENGEKSVFYSTHILSDISRFADEIAFLKDGKLKLKTAKEDLTDKWGRISFLLDKNDIAINASVSSRREGKEQQVVSSDTEVTKKHLSELGAENILTSRMNIEEIAVQILKGGGYVETD